MVHPFDRKGAVTEQQSFLAGKGPWQAVIRYDFHQKLWSFLYIVRFRVLMTTQYSDQLLNFKVIMARAIVSVLLSHWTRQSIFIPDVLTY
jgi:hypothetical protein